MANNKRSKAVVEITKNINKKGHLKGKNKKETRVLVGMCVHHRINKHGKLKPTIFNNGDGYCICTVCGAKFKTQFYENKDLGDVLGDMKLLNNQSKYMATAINAGDQTIDYFARVGVMLEDYKKTYKKVRAVAQKQGNVRSRKKHTQSGSSAYGSWGRN